MEFDEETLTYASVLLDPFVIVNEIIRQKPAYHNWLNKIQNLADEGHPKIDICKRLLKCFNASFFDLRLVQILESAGYAEVAAYLSKPKLQLVSKSPSTSRKNVIYFKDIKRCLVYNKAFECPLYFAEMLYQKIITQIKCESDEKKLQFLHDKLFLSLAVHSDIPLGRQESEPSDLSSENLFRQEAYDKMLEILPKTSNVSLMKMVMFGRLANAFVYKSRKDYDMAEQIINAGRQLTIEVENCPLKIDFYYLDVHYLLRKFERDPRESLQKQLIATARKGLELLEGEEESIRCQWTLMIMMRMIFCLLGISNYCRIIVGCTVHLAHAKDLLGNVDIMWQYMEQKRKLLYYMARARVAELEDNLDLALSYLATATGFASNIHKVDHSFIINYRDELQQQKDRRLRNSDPNFYFVENIISAGSMQCMNEPLSGRPPLSGQSTENDANILPPISISQFTCLHGESEQSIANRNAVGTIHLESMEGSLGSRPSPIGQSFDAIINPILSPYHVSNTHPVSLLSEEGTSINQVTSVSTTSHIYTDSLDRLPSSDPLEELKLSLSDFDSQFGHESMNYEIGTEIIQYEGIKDECKNEDCTISANRLSKLDETEDSSVCYRTDCKKATPKTMVSLLDDGLRPCWTEEEETCSSLQSEYLFGSGGEQNVESWFTFDIDQGFFESLISRLPPSGQSDVDDANALPLIVISQFANLHGESEQRIADRNSCGTFHLEMMDDSLGPRHLPVGQSNEAFVHPILVTNQTSITQPVSPTPEEETSDKQESIPFHIYTDSVERLPSSDSFEGFNLSLSDFNSQLEHEVMNYNIGGEIRQYEGYKTECRYEESTISANRFSKTDEDEDTSVGHSASSKMAASQTRASLLDNGGTISLTEVAEIGSSFCSETLFGDDSKKNEESTGVLISNIGKIFGGSAENIEENAKHSIFHDQKLHGDY
ncbi:hypothetical protein ACJMK2_018860 [Sinanodonta woodiana]|uniref:Uncharacterized protein n=1 Tax=Sinanodonta woodiana TaxID=1069815 RepID=A0ABD3UHF1_SINWO